MLLNFFFMLYSIYLFNRIINELDEILEDDIITLQVMVNADDLGRVIGKKGRIANSIRTLAYACAAREGKKVEILIDQF